MKRILNSSAFFLLLFFSACGRNNPEQQKEFLNGYWEIQKVQTPYGNKDYKMSETIDYIEIKDSTGFRAKVLPRFDGSIVSNGNTETISLTTQNDSLRLHYRTKYDEWTETVLEANQEQLKVRNQKGMVYTYSRYKPIDLKADGLLPEE